MSRFHSYLNTAKTILALYKGEIPLASWLKDFFSKDKKYGSGDRKWISHLCYCYYRTGHAFHKDAIDEKILKGLFLCSHKPNPLLDALWPECNMRVDIPVMEKLKWLNNSKSVADIFPWTGQLSASIDAERFALSHLSQPELFLRIRPGKNEIVESKLKDHEIPFHYAGENCLVLPNSSKIDKLLLLDNEVVVQDYSSQRVGEILGMVRPSRSDHFITWDCCAASGGKSILANDVLGKIDLTVSDIRSSILTNLKKRFALAGIESYRTLVLDLTQPVKGIKKDYFDLIIADLPCSGSGTWSRTPEELYFFKEEEIEKFWSLQIQIIRNIVPHLKPGGSLLYITCSVFKEENEENVKRVINEFGLELSKQKLFQGYEMQADTLFAALLSKR